MESYLQLYQSSPLFEGISRDDMVQLLHCLQAGKMDFPRDSTIFAAGQSATRLGIVLTGRINTVYEDALGGRSILGAVEPGQLFCDAFCCTREQRLPVSVVAQIDSTVLLIDIYRILHTCAKTCGQHQRMTENLVHILAEKYVALNQKLLHLSGRTTRRKLLSYLSEQMSISGGRPFTIPFDRQELADYLFVDRSGLSTEIGKLKREGLLLQTSDGSLLLQGPPCAGNDCGD